MNSRESHHVLAVSPGQIISVFRLLPFRSLILRDRDVRFPPDIGRIGERPQKLRFLQARQSPSDLLRILIEKIDCLPDTAQRRCVDLRLVFTEISYNMGIVCKRISRHRHISVRRDAKTFLFKSDQSRPEMTGNFPFFRMEHKTASVIKNRTACVASDHNCEYARYSSFTASSS